MTNATDLLRSAFASWLEHGEPPDGFLAEDFELRQADSITGTAGVFRGRDGWQDAMSELAEGFDDVEFDLERVAERPDGRVAARIRVSARGRSSGIEADNTISWLWTFEGSQAVKLQVFEDPEGAFS